MTERGWRPGPRRPPPHYALVTLEGYLHGGNGMLAGMELNSWKKGNTRGHYWEKGGGGY